MNMAKTKKDLKAWARGQNLLITDEEVNSLYHFENCRTVRPLGKGKGSAAAKLKAVLNNRIMDVPQDGYEEQNIRTNSDLYKGRVWEAIANSVI
jgi:hypothetical protein